MPTPEQIYPGLDVQVRALRAQGLNDDEILRAISRRAKFLQQTGAEGEAIDAYFKGRASPLAITPQSAQMNPKETLRVLGEYKQQTEVGAAETQDAFRRLRLGDQPKGMQDGVLRGLAKAFMEHGKVFVDELKGGSDMFWSGVRRATSTPQNAEDLLNPLVGALEAGIGGLRIAGSPVTALVRPPAQALAPALRAVTPEAVRNTLSPVGEPLGLGSAENVLEMALGVGLPLAAAKYRAPRPPGDQSKQLSAALKEGSAPPDAAPPPTAPPGTYFDVDVSLPGQAPGEFWNRRGVRKVRRTVGETPPTPEVIAETPTTKVVGESLENKVQRMAEDLVNAQRPVEELAAPVQPITQVSPAEAAAFDEPVTKASRRGRPPTRPVEVRTGSTGFSDEQARVVAAHSLQGSGLTAEQALAKAQSLPIEEARKLAGETLKAFRMAEGELTGKRGRPKTKEALQVGETRTVGGFDTALEPAPVEGLPEIVAEEIAGKKAATLRERTRGGEFTVPTQGANSDAIALSSVRKISASKGYDLTVEVSGENVPTYKLVGPGGRVSEFSTLSEANGYLLTQDTKPLQPVEVPSPTTGKSAFESSVTQAPLTPGHKVALSNQKAVRAAEERTPLSAATGDKAATVTPETIETRPIALKPNAKIGSIEQVETRPQAQQILATAEKQGFKGRVLKTPDGYEVVFFKNFDKDVVNALRLHQRVIQKGVKAIDSTEHVELGRAFGVPDEQIVEYLQEKGFIRSIGGGGGPPAVGATEPGARPLKFANPFASAMTSGSPVLRGLGKDLMEAELAYDHRIKGFQKYMDDMAQVIGGGRGTPNAKRAMALKEGRLAPANAADEKFLQLSQDLTADFASRARESGMLKEAQILENYAPHVTDIDAVYAAFREQFVSAKKFAELPTLLQHKLEPEQFAKFQKIFQDHATTKTIPKDTLRAIQKDVFDFSDMVSNVDNLPQFVKDRIPEDVFVKFMLPRRKGMPYIDDFFQSMEQYIGKTEFALNFNPVLNKWKSVIEQMPGSGIPFTERGYAEMLLNNVVTKRPSWDSRMVSAVLDRTNAAIGRDLFKLQDINAAASLMKSGFLRGVLGPDSALINLTGTLNSWAENGRLLSPLFKAVQKYGKIDTPGVITEFSNLYGEHALTDRSTMQKILNVDRKITSLVLSPQHLTENINRGTAFFAGLEESIAQGLNWKDAFQVGMAKASRIVPNLELTDAQLRAIEQVAATQVGATPATRAPLLLGRGPLGKISTMLLSFPTNQLQLMQRGIREGFTQALQKHDPSRLTRYLALTGFYVGVPYIASQLGADMRNMFGPQSLLPNISFPFFTAITNGYNAVMGDDPLAERKAKQELGNFFGNLGVPQFRYVKKTKDVIENLQRGFAVDKRGRFLYETSPYGEVMRLLGVNPEKAHDAYEMTRQMREISTRHALDKNDAIDAILKGDPSLMAKFSQDWGEMISPEEIMKALQNRMTTPGQRAGKMLPQQLLQRQMMQGNVPQGVVPPLISPRGQPREGALIR